MEKEKARRRLLPCPDLLPTQPFSLALSLTLLAHPCSSADIQHWSSPHSCSTALRTVNLFHVQDTESLYCSPFSHQPPPGSDPQIRIFSSFWFVCLCFSRSSHPDLQPSRGHQDHRRFTLRGFLTKNWIYWIDFLSFVKLGGEISTPMAKGSSQNSTHNYCRFLKSVICYHSRDYSTSLAGMTKVHHVQRKNKSKILC